MRWQHPSRAAPARRVRPARRADRADQAADELRPAHRPRAAAARWHRGRPRPLGRRQRLRAQPARPRLPGRRSRALLARDRRAPSTLELEITEGTIMADPERAAERARAARRARRAARRSTTSGPATPRSADLRELPIDEIKIDRSFVAGSRPTTRDVAIMRSTIELGHNLGCVVVAEGLETRGARWTRCVARLRPRAGLPHRPPARRRLAHQLARRPRRSLNRPAIGVAWRIVPATRARSATGNRGRWSTVTDRQADPCPARGPFP